MGKDYIRIDDRLIHGQIVIGWCKALEIQEIVAIDDKLAANPMLQSIMVMGIPKQYKHHVVTFEQAHALFAQEAEGNRLFVTRMPQDLRQLHQELPKCEIVYLGNAGKTPQAKYNFTKGAAGVLFLSADDIHLMDELTAEGIKIVVQTVPGTLARTWAEVRKSIKEVAL